MNFRRIAALLALIALSSMLCIAPHSAQAGNQNLREHVLFGGSDTDSTEQASKWIPVRGAKRISIRLWSAKAAFHASTDADSTYSDSVTVFRVAFTDSVSSTNPIIAADSVIFTATFLDTVFKNVRSDSPPVNQSLRGPDNGSGIYTWVMPTTPNTGSSDNVSFIASQYMRIYVTPHRRMTVTGGQSSQGKRVNGLKGLRGRAYVFMPNN